MIPTHVSGRQAFPASCRRGGVRGTRGELFGVEGVVVFPFPRDASQVLPTRECICCFPSDYSIIRVYKTD